MQTDTFGRCVVCGRHDSHCDDCHRAHDYQWDIFNAGGGLVSVHATMTIIDRGDPSKNPHQRSSRGS